LLTPSAQPADASLAVARRLFAEETRGATNDAQLVAAADRMCIQVAAGLSRWFGNYGSAALVTRAIARTRAQHPVLDSVVLRPDQSPWIAGLADGSDSHDATAVAEGFVAMLAALIDAMSRLIGEDLTTKLLEQSIAAPPAADVPLTDGKKP
jgi:hypothetical protein